ncbi:putative nuclease HARBI1 isoform X1 [Xenopus laevis]|uniref:Putative nuclease HARBI1 n=2 Tax=Xenopus laevis TaxID=8355 RepID=A0A8J1L3D1_XENLA|nr:putative nuclease HARBI1 isoform X1 [Xenopus laevis]
MLFMSYWLGITGLGNGANMSWGPRGGYKNVVILSGSCGIRMLWCAFLKLCTLQFSHCRMLAIDLHSYVCIHCFFVLLSILDFLFRFPGFDLGLFLDTVACCLTRPLACLLDSVFACRFFSSQIMEIIFPSLFFFHLRKKRMEKVDKPFNNGKQVKRRKCQKIKMFRDRVTLVDLTDTEIKDRYRLNTVEILSLYDVLKVNLCKPTKRSHAIPGLVRLLLALNFFAKGDFQSCIAVIGGVSQSSCSRSLDEVLKAIMLVYKSYVYFPSDSSYLNTVKGKFYEIGGFPNIVGIIDCTHITLCPPADLEHIYRNRKSSHSINVQLVCSFNLKFVDIVAKFPGSSHDSYILSNSSLSERFQQGEFKDSWLLGDCGYPLKLG